MGFIRNLHGMEITMSSRADVDTELVKLTADITQLADENDRLRMINSEMLAALQCALPLLQEGLPGSLDQDCAKEAVAKVQNAIAKGESDP
jgi:hypothetical protein